MTADAIIPTITEVAPFAVFVAAESVVLLNYAAHFTLMQQTAVRFFGEYNFVIAFSLTYIGFAIGGCLGPILAFTISESAGFSPQSFTPFFYLCAGLQFCGGIAVATVLFFERKGTLAVQTRAKAVGALRERKTQMSQAQAQEEGAKVNAAAEWRPKPSQAAT